MDKIVKVNKQLIPIYIDFGKKIFGEIQILYEMIQNYSKNIFPKDIEEDFIKRMKKIGSYKAMYTFFPFEVHTGHAICVSKDDVVAHGFSDKPFNPKKDVVSLDFGVCYRSNKINSFINFDFAFTVGPHEWVKEPLKALNKIIKYQPENTMEIAKIIEDTDMKKVVQLTGHGIGEELHMAPAIYNMTGQFNSFPLIEGMAFCPEPIYTKKVFEEDEIEHIYIDENNEIKTASGQQSTHWETTMVVHNNKIIDVVGITNLEKE